MRCAYRATAPVTEQGQFVWATFKDEAWRIRVAGMGAIIGVDLEVARRKCSAACVIGTVADDLLAACEKGAVAAWNEREDQDGQQD